MLFTCVLMTSLLWGCVAAGERESATRGAGVYPGRPAECDAPTPVPVGKKSLSLVSVKKDSPVPGGKEYRNLALNRIATSSSSYDYNLTAQLATDGLINEGEAPWFRLLQDGVEVPRETRDRLTDQKPSTALPQKKGGSVFQLEFHGYEIIADKLEIAGKNEQDRPFKGFSAEISSDGENWISLGSTESYSLDLPEGAPISYCRVCPINEKNSTAPLRTVRFMKDGKEIDVLSNGHFHSAWKSAAAENEWICVDLGAVSSLDKIVLSWKNAPVSGHIETSKDARKWNKATTFTKDDASQIKLGGKRARFVRAVLDRTADGLPFELDELEVYGRGGIVLKAQPAREREGDRQYLSRGAWKLTRDGGLPDGEALSSEGYDDGAWLCATVPGTVLTSYINAGAVPDPKFADNQLHISDSYFRSAFWYRDVFTAFPDGERQYLHFDGINWKAEVFLNGERLGSVDGAFREEEFDVTGKLREGTNCLAVKILPNEHYGTAKEQTAWSTQPNGGIPGADNPTMHPTIGWDWIPTVRGRGAGIWDDVYLSFRGPVSVKDPFVRTVLPLPDTSCADIFIEATLVNDSKGTVSGRFVGSFGESAFSSGELSLSPGERRLVRISPAEAPALHIRNPRLWWPRGYGQPNLYDVHLAFETSEGVSDSCSFKSGIRQMSYKVEPFTPSPSIAKGNYPIGDNPERLCLYINGRRFIGFGGNWGYPELLLNYRDREYDTAVEYHADMNFTLIRNWVGQIGDREFYEACDRHGVMVWQDFWLANPSDGPDPYYEDNFNETATRYVRRIRNHPCIAIYVGRNEGFPPEKIDSHLRKTVSEEHPGICYYPHSAAYQLSGGGPYNLRPVEEYFTLFGQDRLHSERGMPNVMNYENLIRAFGEDNINPVSTLEHPNRMYGLHDYTLGGIPGASSAQRADTFNKAIEKAFGEPADAKQFTQWAQWFNYEGYRAMFEGRSTQRRGLLLWMSHPAWPSMVWQTYDYYFEPTAAYFGCKKACEPVHILYNPVKRTVDAVNYHGGDLSGLKACAEIFNLRGESIWSREASLDLKEDSTAECFPVEVPGDAGEVWFLRLKLLDRNGTAISENIYWQGREEGNYKALHSVGEAKLHAQKQWTESEDSYTCKLTLENGSDKPAMMLRLKAVHSRSGELVLPVFWSDNYIFLMPGESRELTVRVRKEDCPDKPALYMEGFNVKAKKV